MGGGTRGGLAGGELRPVRRRESCCNAATWLSVRGARGEPGEGFWRASVMSCKPARIRSFEEARGMVTLVGNQETVSAMRSARESHSQTV
jgi:hypothetical protein